MKPRRVTSSDGNGKRRAIIDACRRMNALGINQGMLPARRHNGCMRIGRPPLLLEAEIELARGRMAGHGHADV
jgi:hypothetical protein